MFFVLLKWLTNYYQLDHVYGCHSGLTLNKSIDEVCMNDNEHCVFWYVNLCVCAFGMCFLGFGTSPIITLSQSLPKKSPLYSKFTSASSRCFFSVCLFVFVRVYVYRCMCVWIWMICPVALLISIMAAMCVIYCSGVVVCVLFFSVLHLFDSALHVYVVCMFV